jgi:lipopolysaccharide export system protein LptA
MIHCRNALLLLVFAAGGAHGLASEREQPIYLEADRVEIDDPRGISIYEGNVEMTRGSMHLTADRMTVYMVENEVDRIIVVGDPATYRQRPEGQREDIRAEAQRIEYHADGETVILLDRARMWQGPNEFRSDRIVYELLRDVVSAGDEATAEKRVQIILHPRREPAPAE